MSDIRFASDIFPLDVIKKAAYRYTDRYSFDFALDGNEIICRLKPLGPINADELEQFDDNFRNAVLDEDLRRRVSAGTSAIRNAILAHAFSRTGLQDDE